jgi:hypothetical protein
MIQPTPTAKMSQEEPRDRSSYRGDIHMILESLRRPVGKGQWAGYIAAMIDDAELRAELRRAGGEQ